MSDSDDSNPSTLGGRVKRYARVGASVGSVAARVAGKKFLGLNLDNEKYAGELKSVLGGLKGPLMKVAQILATVPDLLPEEYTAELIQLQSNAPSMGWSFVKRRMNTELGRDWADRFETFDREASHAASLGQVHRAMSLDNQALACKLQYPDMSSAVEADLKQLKLAFSIYRRYDAAIDPTEIHKELSERLREELDYKREAQNMALYSNMLKDEAQVHVPGSIDELSTNRLLSMTWLEGQPLLNFIDSNIELRNTVALNMFRAWYVPFYYYGVIHGDPHLGNYSIRPNGDVNLLDFGSIRVFKPSFMGAVINLYRALRDNDKALAVHAYETWGFKDLSVEMIEVLNHWARFLYAPLLEDKVRPIQEAKTGNYGAEVAAKVHLELKRLGGVTPPREFVLMDRAAIGLGSVFLHLNAEVNWHRLFHGLIDHFEEGKLAERQSKILQQVGLNLAE
jgi:predicted unusual protein kinase regulating ubiquinone biosynthesis (AarF/ABC1/UbiB family)